MDVHQIGKLLREGLGVGLESHDIRAWQMAIRALLVYFAAIVLIRIASTRFMGKNTALDLVLAVIIGSVLGRSITGNSPLLPVFAAALTLVVFHYVLAGLAFRFRPVSRLVKGNAAILVEDGKVNWDNMRRFQIGEQDLLEALRTRAKLENISDVKRAYLERNGDISVIPSAKD
jgi:uncharacterized membrane protein YcaP (DUF421 family)